MDSRAQAAIVSNGLVARYNAANASSYSGSGNRLNNLQNVGYATLYNSPSYNAIGSPYLSFNGSNQYFMTENLTNFFPGTFGSKSNAISVYLWVYPTDAGVLVAEQGQTTIDGGWYDAQIEITNVIGNSGTLRCGTWSGSVIQSVSTTITLNQWNFIGFTHNGSTLKAYLNGVSFGTKNYTRASPFNNNANQYYTFGAGTATNMGDGTYTNARFGQMGVYNTALTDAEMAQNYETVAAPSLASSSITFSAITTIGFGSSWTNGNGLSRLVVCRPSTAGMTYPSNYTNYTANSIYGSGTALGSGYIVGSGAISSLTLSNLQANTNYCLDIFEYNGSISSSNALFLSSSSLTGCRTTLVNIPSIGSSAFNTSAISSNGWSGNWTIGNGSNRIVICRPSAASQTAPSNFSNYTANSVYGAGSTIGSGYVVGTGAINSIAISNLSASTAYCIDVYEFNGSTTSSTAVFGSTALSACNTTYFTTPSVAPSSFNTASISSNAWSGNWTIGNGSNRIVICRPSASSQTAPSNFSNYTANSVYGAGSTIGSGYVVGAGAINSIAISNLSASTAYCIDVYEFNGSTTSSTAVFGSTALSACNTTYFTTPSVAPSSFNTVSISSNAWSGNWTFGNGSNRIVICRPSAANQTAPSNFSNYTANSAYGAGSTIGSGYVVGAGAINSIAISNLSANTAYCIDVYEFNGSSSTAVFGNTALSACNTTNYGIPSTGSSNLTFTTVTDSSLFGQFSSGAGTGRLIVCRPSHLALTNPQNNTVYAASTTYGQGSTIGNGFVIGIGNSANLTVSGLTANAAYCIDIFEYNGIINDASAVFNTNHVLTNCQKTNMVYPFTGASAFTVTQNNPTSLSVSWTRGDGNSRIVLVSTSPINSTPNDATVYIANASFAAGDTIGNAYVAYNGDGNSFTLNNLDPNTTYYFSVIEYTINGEEPAYASSLALLDSVTTIPADTDSDGVVDVDDMFPNDPNKAYATSYPASGFGSLLFEDLWPAVGDYDFNDLVIDYNYTVVANADNNAVEATFKFVTRAIGGALHNGFAFQINGLDPAKISSITGTKTTGITWTTINPNGTEVGNTSNANIPVFKDAYDLLPTTGGYWFVNVDPNAPDVGTDTTTVVITFINNGVVPEAGTAAASILSSVNFNPYIVVAQERGKEVHLANMPPSQLMNMSYFGSIDDRSVPAASNYFKSEQGLPWALNIDQSIPYTIEKTDFVNAYPNFFIWANSGGTNNTNWYTNQAGNRVTNNLIIRN